MGQARRRIALLLFPASLAGCGGGGYADDRRPSLRPDCSRRPPATARPMRPPRRCRRGPTSGFNPFTPEQSATPPGGREVIANPTVADVMQTGTLPEMALGRADAPVTIVQYASLTCPYCRNFHLETFPQFKQRVHRHRQGALHPARVPDRQDVRRWPRSRCAAPRPTSTSTLYGKFMRAAGHLGLPGGAARPHIQGRRAGGDDAARSSTPAARIRP